MINNTDWLALEPPKTPARERIKNDPKFREMVEHTKTLTAQQRNFIAAYAAAHYDPVLACKLYREKFGRDMSPKRLARWMQEDENFLQAIAMREEIAARATGASVARTVSMLQEISRRNFVGKPVLDKDDKPVLDAEGKPAMATDDRAAMQALEMIGKHLKMFKPDEQAAPPPREGPGLVIQINAGPQQQPAIDVTPERVAITLPEPGK